nr:hypothetical protein GCM10020092_023660 [Actinoplanes digitatis]
MYYTNAVNETYAECGGRAEWAGLVCRVQPGGGADSGPELLVQVSTYDLYGQLRTKVDKNSGGTRRTTTIKYDGAGRPVEHAITASSGKALDKTRAVYDAATGLALRSQTVNAAGAVTAEIVRGYDALGRQISYKDADGNISTAGYDLLGRVATQNDGKATRTYTYDGGSERRGLPTAVNDTQAGEFTVAYDADGSVVTESWPNGVVVTRAYDEIGNALDQSYARPGCGQASCGLFSEVVGYDVHNKQQWANNTFGQHTYDYDMNGRMTLVKDTVGGSCTARRYGFDESSNRTSTKTFAQAADGKCQTATAATSKSSSYDNADRATTNGYVYDLLGRTTTLPSAETQNAASNVTIGYYVNDMVSTVTQNGRTTDYTVDVLRSRTRFWTDNITGTAVQSTHHYADDEDNPTWTQETATRYTRVIRGLGGMAAIWNSAASQSDWQISNMHGDVVASISGSSAGLTSTRDFDEYGQARNAAEVGKVRYGWHGAQQRAADAPPPGSWSWASGCTTQLVGGFSQSIRSTAEARTTTNTLTETPSTRMIYRETCHVGRQAPPPRNGTTGGVAGEAGAGACTSDATYPTRTSIISSGSATITTEPPSFFWTCRTPCVFLQPSRWRLPSSRIGLGIITMTNVTTRRPVRRLNSAIAAITTRNGRGCGRPSRTAVDTAIPGRDGSTGDPLTSVSTGTRA